MDDIILSDEERDKLSLGGLISYANKLLQRKRLLTDEEEIKKLEEAHEKVIEIIKKKVYKEEGI